MNRVSNDAWIQTVANNQNLMAFNMQLRQNEREKLKK